MIKVKESVEKEMATHISILAWKSSGTEELAGCSPWGYKTEHACMRVEGDGLVAVNQWGQPPVERRPVPIAHALGCARDPLGASSPRETLTCWQN